MQAMCSVGELLHKDLGEIRSLPISELHTWIAWMAFKNDAEKKAMDKAKRESKSSPRPSRLMGRR